MYLKFTTDLGITIRLGKEIGKLAAFANKSDGKILDFPTRSHMLPVEQLLRKVSSNNWAARFQVEHVLKILLKMTTMRRSLINRDGLLRTVAPTRKQQQNWEKLLPQTFEEYMINDE
jgi:hypothetical protein